MSNAGHHSSLDIRFMNNSLCNGKIKRFQGYNIYHFEGIKFYLESFNLEPG